MSGLSAAEYAAHHDLHAVLKSAVKHVVRERPTDPLDAIGRYLLDSVAIAQREAEFRAWEAEQEELASLHRRLSSGNRRESADAEDMIRRMAEAQVRAELQEERTTLDAMHPSSPASKSAPPSDPPSSGGDSAAAAKTIAGYMRCMSSKLRTSGKGEQNAEMMIASRSGGALVIEDLGGWAQRNESMARMLRQLDASGALPDFPPVVIQTGDRCIAKRTAGDGVELDLWQQQPVPESVAASLPLRRVLSMCTTPKYADVPVPDWCFDAWPEAGVVQGTFDEACARLAQVGAAPPTEGNQLSWCGTAHHHPSRMTLMDLAAAHPDKLACVNVVDKSIDKSKHRTLAEQVQGFPYLLDVQGKGYSSRLKLLLHTGRVIFIAKRPWQEYFADGLKPMVHYVPVKEDLSDLVDMVEWASSHPEEAAQIGKAGQEFAQAYLTEAAALKCLAKAITDGSAWPPPTSEDATGVTDDALALRKGDWASNRGAYDAVRMYYRWTFMPVSKDRRRPLSLIASRGHTDYSHMELYTFGVYTGASLKFWFEQFEALKITHGTHWGFDSFEGLPPEADGVELECNAWLPGSFSAADQFNAYTFGEVRQRINEYLGPSYASSTQLIKGFFSDSLTPTLVSEKQMKPALLVDVDVDLYISAIQCLEWMFVHGLIVVGTVIYYDDVSIIKADKGGELRAHDEITAKYNVTWRKLHDSCWEVLSIG